MFDLRNGDCLEELMLLDENSVDSIVTDPPYHLTSIVKRFGKEGSAPAKYQNDGAFQRVSAGFMGQAWDGGDISFKKETWEKCLRVLKPGGHILAFGGSRTYHRIACAIEDAGFEIRDTIMWVYGSGLPKSHNLKDEWVGWGTALKPAYEPIVLARKPFKGTIADNILKWRTGCIHIDACRIPTSEDLTKNYKSVRKSDAVMGERVYKMGFRQKKDSVAEATESTLLGRWPANFIHDGSEEVLALMPETGVSQGGKAGNSDAYCGGFDEEYYADMKPGFGDSGSAARYFYCAKASRQEKDEGCDARNNHPTVKPLDLMRYLCKLVTPKKGIVLDPFMGSGSTGKAAMLENFDFIGIEKEKAYFDTARARIEASCTDLRLF